MVMNVHVKMYMGSCVVSSKKLVEYYIIDENLMKFSGGYRIDNLRS